MPSGVYKHKPHSNETKKKLSLSKIGNKHFFGKKHTAQAILKIKKSRAKQVGTKHPRYIDGLSIIKRKSGFYTQRRRARKFNNGGSHTYGEWELLKKQYNYTCPCCKKSEPEIKLTEDHIIPLSKGGSDLIENIQPLCNKCNSKKNSKIIKFNYGVS